MNMKCLFRYGIALDSYNVIVKVSSVKTPGQCHSAPYTYTHVPQLEVTSSQRYLTRLWYWSCLFIDVDMYILLSLRAVSYKTVDKRGQEMYIADAAWL